MLGWNIAEGRSVTEGGEEHEIIGTNLYYKYCHNGKFEDDKVVIDNSAVFLLLDGVILNKKELMEGLEISWEDYVLKEITKNMESFLKCLRGTFNGVFIEKKENRIRAFVDQLGERSVFYYNNSDKLLIASNYNFIVQRMNEYNIPVEEEKEAVKYMLYYGYMMDGRTYIKDVMRVFPGNIFLKADNRIEEKEYFRFDNSDILDCSDDELIEMIDTTFVRALKREFDKDVEYGYESLVDLSGGMDARAVCFVAKKLGYKNITNICYSQMNAYERSITEKLVDKLGNDYIFKSLNNAGFIYDVDQIVQQNYGVSYYAGITGGKDLLSLLDSKRFGIEHTGLLGDVYGGSFSVDPIYEKPKLMPKFRFSNILDIDIDTTFLESYKENELLWFYTRGLLGGLGTHLIRQNYFETYSPFEDVDVLNLMFRIPLKKRITERIYVKWLEKKYPESVEVPYAQTMCKPTSGTLKIKFMVGWKLGYHKVLQPVLHKFNKNIPTNYKGTMNPFEYWYETNSQMREFIEQYYTDNLQYVSGEIKENLEIIREKGGPRDKLVGMTVLSVYKIFQVRSGL